MPVGDGAIRVRTGRSVIEGVVELDREGSRAAGTAAAPLSTRIRPGPSLRGAGAWLAEQADAQADRWTLWTPVALGCGCAAYFGLMREPQAWVAWVLLPVVLGLLVATRWSAGRVMTIALVLIACAVGGFAVAKLRAEAVKAPIAQAGARPQQVEAWVVDIAQPGEGGQRLLLAPVRVGDWDARATPIRMRVTLRPGTALPRPGQTVRVLAIVNPPPPPASPGSYDFARDAYFESVGGVGLALRPPEVVAAEAPAPWRLRLAMRVNALRWSLTERIVVALGPETGGLAAAMTTGHEAFIPKEQVENLRAAGLAHIISISGLHMAIVGGFAFAGARLAVAAWPWLALRINGKKAAALVGLAAVGGYLVLSGAPPPAERAAITAAVAFAAILADRQAISLHALALAAMGVLLLQPEAVTEPGFQMSFAATAALVALAEIWPRPVKEIDVPWWIRWPQAAVTWTAASLAVSFVAGLATGPFAIQHFNRVSTWGLFANLAVAPISSFLMMPGLALGAALTPFGLGKAPLEVAGWSIGLMNRVAEMAATAPTAQIVVPSAPDWVLPASFLGLLFVCLWKGSLRWAGLPLALAIVWAPRPPAPDVWVAADGAAVAVREGDKAVLLRPDVKLFGAELWARRRGLAPLPSEPERDARFACDRWSCLPGAGAPVRLAAAWNLRRPLKEGRLDALCAGADVVILRNALRPESCPASLVLNGADFAAGGSAELYRKGDGWRIVWAQDRRGRRPWTWGYDPR
jgi:competence protein ComEC